MLLYHLRNLKIGFEERRFVFGGDPPAEGAIVDLGRESNEEWQKRQEAEKRAGVEKEKVVAGEAKDGKKKRVRVKASMSFEQLKSELGLVEVGAVLQLMNSLDLTGFDEVKSIISDSDLNFESPNNKAVIFGKLLERLKAKNFDSLGGLIEAKEGDLSEVFAHMLTGKVAKKLNAQFASVKKVYDLYKSKPENANLQIQYKVKFSGVEPICIFEGDEGFNAALAADKAERAAKNPDNAENEAVGGMSKQEVKDKAVKLAATPIGRVLAFFAPKDKDGNPDLTQVIMGQDMVGVFICGIFGYTDYVGDAYGGLVEMLPEKYKGKIEIWEKKARASKLSADRVKKTVSSDELLASAQAMEGNQFGEYYKNNWQLPPTGMALGADYALNVDGKPNTLLVHLEDDAIVALPKDVTANVNGQTSTAGQIYDKGFGQIMFAGTIPKGTVFKGKVRFETAETQEKAEK